MCGGLQFWRHFDVIGSIIFGGLHFWRHWFNTAKILSKFGEQQLVMVNYACGFNQSETGKYFEWIIKPFNAFYWVTCHQTATNFFCGSIVCNTCTGSIPHPPSRMFPKPSFNSGFHSSNGLGVSILPRMGWYFALKLHLLILSLPSLKYFCQVAPIRKN